MSLNPTEDERNGKRIKVGASSREKWNVPASVVSKRTVNPIREVVFNMKVAANPNKEQISLALGDPTHYGNFKLPENCIESVIKQLKSYKANGYPPAIGKYSFRIKFQLCSRVLGCDEAREALAQKFSTKEAPLTSKDIILASGASDALNLSIVALCNEGQNILIPRPGFSLYQTISESKGIECRYYNLLAKHLISLIDDQTACILINNPSNPCGSNFTRQHLESLLTVAETYKLVIISDEIYEDMVFGDEKFYPLASLTTTVPILKVSGLAKRFLIPGWRVGWIFIHDRNEVLSEIRQALFALSNLILGANSLIQYSLSDMILNTPDEFFLETNKKLEVNAKLSTEILSSIPGLHVIVPQGAMYVMVGINIDEFRDIKNDVEFSEKLLEEESIMCLPGKIKIIFYVMESKGVSPGDPMNVDLSENNTVVTPEVQSTDTPTSRTKTKKSKWESESDKEESESDEQSSQPELAAEGIKRLKVSHDGQKSRTPSINSGSPVVEPTNEIIEISSPSANVETTTPQANVEKVIKPMQTSRPPMITGCRSVDNYEKLNRIEEGAYGVVFRARDKATGEIVALKKLKLDKEKNGFPITSLREVDILRFLRLEKHPNIVNVRELVVGDTLTQIFIVMDFVEHDLKSLMEDMQSPFLQSEVKTIMLQLLSAVAMLHDSWIVHRDLKTSNLLLNNRGQIKVADFGLARKYGSPLGPMTGLVVTLWYRAPELLLGIKEYSTAVDMWSVGCIFGELVNKEPLLPGRAELDQLNKIFELLGMPNEKIWPGFSKLPYAKNIPYSKQSHNTLRSRFPYLTENGINLMSKLLTYDPAKRITAEEALKHPYFTESPLPKDPEMFPTWPSKGGGERRKSFISPSAPKAAHGAGEFDEEEQAFLGSIFENQGGNDYGFRLK
ncbi:12555_t:CDS:10, partial [Acaulospora morrowiae]